MGHLDLGSVEQEQDEPSWQRLVLEARPALEVPECNCLGEDFFLGVLARSLAENPGFDYNYLEMSGVSWGLARAVDDMVDFDLVRRSLDRTASKRQEPKELDSCSLDHMDSWPRSFVEEVVVHCWYVGVWDIDLG